MAVSAYTGTISVNGSSTYDVDMKAWIDWLNNTFVPALNSATVGDGVTIVQKAADYTAVNGDEVWFNTTAAAYTLTLPAAPGVGERVWYNDEYGQFDSNALTIQPGSKKMDGSVATQTDSRKWGRGYLMYTGITNGWRLFKT